MLDHRTLLHFPGFTLCMSSLHQKTPLLWFFIVFSTDLNVSWVKGCCRGSIIMHFVQYPLFMLSCLHINLSYHLIGFLNTLRKKKVLHTSLNCPIFPEIFHNKPIKSISQEAGGWCLLFDTKESVDKWHWTKTVENNEKLQRLPFINIQSCSALTCSIQLNGFICNLSKRSWLYWND